MGRSRKIIEQDTATTVSQYIAKKLEAIVGTGCRYPDNKMLFKVSREVARQFNEPEAMFPNPGGKICNQRQIKLLSALLGLTHREYFLTLCPLAINEQEGATREEQENKFSHGDEDEDLSYDAISQKVDTIINNFAKNLPAKAEVVKTEVKQEAAPIDKEQLDFQQRILAKIQARKAAERLEAEAAILPKTGVEEAPVQHPQPTPEEKNGDPFDPKKSEEPENTYIDLFKKAKVITRAFYLEKEEKKSKGGKEHAYAKLQERIKPRIKAAPPERMDVQATNGHNPKHEVKSPEIKIDLKFPDNKRGNELLAYAHEKNITFGTLLEEMRSVSGGSQNAFSESLGLERSQYGKFVRNEQKKPALSLMNELADKLGAETEENRVQWRQFMLNIPVEVDQGKIDHCLNAGSPINTEHTGFGHRIALAKFFTMLAHRHGLVEWTQLANAIVARAGMDKTIAIQLQRAMDTRAGPQGNADLDPSQIDADRLAAHDNRGVKMPEPLADIITKFAFPGDEERQKTCLAFLTSDKYLMPEAEEKAHRSEALRNIRKARGDNWGKRVSKKTGETAIE